MLEQDICAELRATADSLEAELELGFPNYRDMLALVAQLRVWSDDLSHIGDPAVPMRQPARITAH